MIDAHQHFWDPAQFDYPWMEAAEMAPLRRRFGPGDLAPLLAANGVDATIVVQCCSSIEETEAFLAIAETTPFVAGVVGWVDLSDPAIDATLTHLASRPKLVGIRHQVHDEDDPRWLPRPDVRRGLEAVFRHGLAYDLLVRTRELGPAIEMIRDAPQGHFILNHAAKPTLSSGITEAWRAGIAALAEQPNVWCKLSGLLTEADWRGWTAAQLMPAVRHVWNSFGANRVIFGSDWPVCLLASNYAEVKRVAATCLRSVGAEDGSQVWGANAIEAYRLNVGEMGC